MDADRLEEHPNTLAINFMSDAETPRRLKRKLLKDLCIQLYYKLYMPLGIYSSRLVQVTKCYA